jgi:cysteine desulfuration protein SufE
LAIFSGREAAEILATDAFAIYERLGLAAHLTPQRSNGVRAMIDRIKRDAQTAAAA